MYFSPDYDNNVLNVSGCREDGFTEESDEAADGNHGTGKRARAVVCNIVTTNPLHVYMLLVF